MHEPVRLTEIFVLPALYFKLNRAILIAHHVASKCLSRLTIVVFRPLGVNMEEQNEKASRHDLKCGHCRHITQVWGDRISGYHSIMG